MVWAEAYLHTKCHLDPSSATTDVGQKLGGSAPIWEKRSWVRIQHNVAQAEAYLRTKWHLDPFSHLATIDMGRKLGELAPLGEGELGPHLMQCGQGRGLPAGCMPSFILIHLNVGTGC